jgi:hypothetical protein
VTLNKVMKYEIFLLYKPVLWIFKVKVKVKISLLQAMEAHRVARG